MTSALHLLHRAGQCADEMFASQIGDSDITPRQFAVLTAVAEGGEPSQTTLVMMTGIDRSTIADIVRRLVQRGLVTRKRTKNDARTYAVRLTAQGEATITKAEPAARVTDERLLSAMPQRERQVLLSALAKIVKLIGEDEGKP